MGLKERYTGNIKGDLFGGVTAGIVALPLALGFGMASGLPNGALVGMYGAVVVGLIAALFGGTSTQVSGPTGPMTVVVAGVVAGMSQGDPRWIFVMIALAGAFQILLGVLKIGRYINYIPYPVVSGFMSGIGVIIIILQVAQALGHDYLKSPVAAVKAIPEQLGDVNPAALVICLGTIALIYATPRVTKAVPGTLVGLVVMTVVSVLWGPEILRIGEIPREVPKISLPAWDWGVAQTILLPAFMLAVVGSLDSLLTSLVADALTKTRHDSRQELVGQGLGNLCAGFLGGLPGAGATMRTVVNIDAGGKTHLSGITHSVLLILILAVLGPLAERIPMAVLAGILMTVGIGIIDTKGLKHVFKVPRGDAVVMVTVLVLTVFVDLMWAVGVGMVMASLLLVKRLSDMDPATHSPLLDVASHSVPSLGDLPEEVLKGVYLVEIHGSLFFGNAGPLQRQVSGIEGADEIVLHLGDMRYVDQSGAYVLLDMAQEAEKRGARLYLCELHEEPRDMLASLAIAPGAVPAERIFERVEDAMEAAAKAHGANHEDVAKTRKKMTARFHKEDLSGASEAASAEEASEGAEAEEESA